MTMTLKTPPMSGNARPNRSPDRPEGHDDEVREQPRQGGLGFGIKPGIGKTETLDLSHEEKSDGADVRKGTSTTTLNDFATACRRASSTTLRNAVQAAKSAQAGQYARGYRPGVEIGLNGRGSIGTTGLTNACAFTRPAGVLSGTRPEGKAKRSESQTKSQPDRRQCEGRKASDPSEVIGMTGTTGIKGIDELEEDFPWKENDEFEETDGDFGNDSAAASSSGSSGSSAAFYASYPATRGQTLPVQLSSDQRRQLRQQQARAYERTIATAVSDGTSSTVDCAHGVVRGVVEKAIRFMEQGFCPYSGVVRRLGTPANMTEAELVAELALIEEILASSEKPVTHWEKRKSSPRRDTGIYAALARRRSQDLGKIRELRRAHDLFGRAEALLVRSVMKGRVTKGVALMAFRGMCRREGIDVKLEGVPRTDGTTIWMGPINFASPLAPIYVWGHGIHERNHVRHSDFAEVAATEVKLRELVNVFEDIRVDALGIEEFGSYRSWREALFRALLEIGQLALGRASLPPAERFMGWLLGDLTEHVLKLDLPEAVRKKSELQMKEDFGEPFVEKLRAFVRGRFPLGSTADAVELAKDVMAFLKEESEAAAEAVTEASLQAEAARGNQGSQGGAIDPAREDGDEDDTEGDDGDDDESPTGFMVTVDAEQGTSTGNRHADAALGGLFACDLPDAPTSDDPYAVPDDLWNGSLFVGNDLRPNGLVAVGKLSPRGEAQARRKFLEEILGKPLPSVGLRQGVEALARGLATGSESAVSPEDAEKSRAATAAQITQLPSGGWAKALRREGCPVMPKGIFESVWKKSAGLGIRLADLLRRPVPEPVRTGSNGFDLDDTVLDRLPVGDDRVFLEWGTPPGLDMAVLILCDVSGSLGNVACAMLKAAAGRLQEAMDRISGVNAQVAIFPEAPKTAQAATRWTSKDAELVSVPKGGTAAKRIFMEILATVPAWGGTPVAGALSFAYRFMAERQETHKLVLMLTDGYFKPGEASTMCDALADAGVRLSVLNLREPDAVEPVIPIGDVSVTVRSQEEIPLGLRRLLERLKAMGAFG